MNQQKKSQLNRTNLGRGVIRFFDPQKKAITILQSNLFEKYFYNVFGDFL